MRCLGKATVQYLERRKNYLFDHMDKEMAEEMEEVRLGRKEIK